MTPWLYIFPQQFRKIFQTVKGGKFDINAFGVRMNKLLHLKGQHGGGYNQVWEDFLSRNKARIKEDPMFLIGFGFGLMNELGFGNFSVIDY